MCSGALSLQSQLDFHRSSDSQKCGKLGPKFVVLRSKILTILLLGGPWSDLGVIFAVRKRCEKISRKKTSGRTLWSVPAECAEAVGGRGVRNIKQNFELNLTRLVPLLRTEDGAADSKRYAHSTGPAKYFEEARISKGPLLFSVAVFRCSGQKNH